MSMSTATKVWLIVAASLVLVGCMIFGGVMVAMHWDFTKLSTNKYETNEHKIEEDFDHISIVISTADIVIMPSEDETSSVVCHEQEKVKHSVTVQDGTLTVDVDDTRKWYEHIGINWGTPKVTVYLPKEAYGSLRIKSSTGDVEIPKDIKLDSIDVTATTGDVRCNASAEQDIRIKTSTGRIDVTNVSADTIDLSVTTGRVSVSNAVCEGDVSISVSTGRASVSDVKCQNLTSTGDTGDILLTQVVASKTFSIERDTGDVRFKGCDADEMVIVTDTGDVTGTFLSDKVFIYKTDTGDVDLPRTQSGGRCDITTDTGDIRISIRP